MALQQVDIAGRQMNRLVDLRSRRRGVSAGQAESDIEYFKITSTDDDTIEATHQTLSEGSWSEGDLGTEIELTPFPDTTATDYETNQYVAAILDDEQWIILSVFPEVEFPSGSVMGDMLYYTGTAWAKLAAPTGLSKKYVLVAETDADGGVTGLSWNLVEEFECPEDVA
jgi:hypothetical protein